MSYYTLARQSNLLSSDSLAAPSPHTLHPHHISTTSLGLLVTLMSTKTTIAPHSLPLSPYCPVAAWLHYYRLMNPARHGPAFLTPAGTPFTYVQATKSLRYIFNSLGHPNATAFTLHGFRRGGVQAMLAGGAPLQAVMAQGHWLSAAVKSYTSNSVDIRAPVALASQFRL